MCIIRSHFGLILGQISEPLSTSGVHAIMRMTDLRAIKSPTHAFPPLLLHHHTSFVFSKKVWQVADVESAVQKLHVNKRIASLPRLPPKQKSRWSWIWSRGAKEVACCACELTTSKIGKRSHDEGRLWKVVQIQRSTSDVSVVQHHPNHGTARSAFSC